MFWVLEELLLHVICLDLKNAVDLSSIEEVRVVSMSIGIPFSSAFQHQPDESLQGKPNAIQTGAVKASCILDSLGTDPFAHSSSAALTVVVGLLCGGARRSSTLNIKLLASSSSLESQVKQMDKCINV